VGLLRASAGLSIAALAVAACVRLLRLRAPKAEQWAWMIVLAQGVILFPGTIPGPRGDPGAGNGSAARTSRRALVGIASCAGRGRSRDGGPRRRQRAGRPAGAHRRGADGADREGSAIPGRDAA